MTKRKVMEDFLSHSKRDMYAKVGDYNVYSNAEIIIADINEIPIDIERKDEAVIENIYNDCFSNSMLYELSNAIEVDYKALKAFIKEHKRWEKKPFIIYLGKERYLCVNPWYLRNMIEYLSDRWEKNYRIFIQNKFNSNGICISPIYMFGGNNMEDQKLLILPVNWYGPLGYHMECEVSW